MADAIDVSADAAVAHLGRASSFGETEVLEFFALSATSSSLKVLFSNVTKYSQCFRLWAKVRAVEFDGLCLVDTHVPQGKSRGLQRFLKKHANMVAACLGSTPFKSAPHQVGPSNHGGMAFCAKTHIEGRFAASDLGDEVVNLWGTDWRGSLIRLRQ